MLKEFKEFAIKGNLVEIAVAFVMGAAFGKVISSFVDGIAMPLVGMLTGGIDFSDKTFVLKNGVEAVKNGTGKIITPAIAEVSVKYGIFITNVLDFIIVAFAVFMVIKGINKTKKEEPTPVLEAPVVSSTDALLIEIRDSLKK